MNANDGRVVSNFVVAALAGEPLEIYGDGSQTRSLMYIHDLVTGLMALMASDCSDPVNIGSEDESTVKSWAEVVRDTVVEMRESGEVPCVDEDGKELPVSEIVFKDAVVDDPPKRRPDITRARNVLKWEPTWSELSIFLLITPIRTDGPSTAVKAGIEETIRYFAAHEI